MSNKIIQFLNIQGKGLSLLLTMTLGALFPQVHALSFLIQYLLMIMLFYAFLGIDFKRRVFQKSVLWIVLANLIIPVISYISLIAFNQTLAQAAFMTAIAPTAIAAPVLISFIQKKVEYVVAALLITNIAVALVIPFALPVLVGADVQISVWQVLKPVASVMFLPLVLALAVSRLSSHAQTFIRKGKFLSFPLWLANLFIISANASDFLHNGNPTSGYILITIALVSLVICIANFGIGAVLGGPAYWQESSQSLGQKNLAFVIWVAITFINPLVAMGPTFYILYHHLYNSWSIYQFEKRRSAEIFASSISN
jgi:BASS family bile acid:Na+ symporter